MSEYIYYVYAYLREDRSPYYIGKGSGNRAYVRGKHERIKRPKDKSRIIFIAKDLPESTAFEVEKFMIRLYGRKESGTGILQNYTDGGEGSSGVVVSAAARRKRSEFHKGRKHSEEHNRKKSEAQKGKPKSEAHCKNIAEAKARNKKPRKEKCIRPISWGKDLLA